MKEFILCASLKFGENIITGHRHSDCYTVIMNLFPHMPDDKLPQREDQGFLTSLNRFVGRKEAWDIARENNQIQYGLKASGEDSQLISENLY